MSLQNDRMLFFDFMPSGQGNLNGYNIRFHVYTLTGSVLNPSSWKMVLKGVDGLLFVADSSPDGMPSNVESYRELNAVLATYGKILGEIPCVIQCNKQDLPRALAPIMIERELTLPGSQVFPAVASKGEGVLESVFALIRMILRDIRAEGIEMEEEHHHSGFTASGLPADDLVQKTVRSAVEDRGPQSGPFPELIPSPAVSSPDEVGDVGIDGSDEPFLEIAGDMEIIDGGGVQLPLSIKYGGKVKQVKLNISLAPFVN
jgi:hypothetical protein